VIITLNAPFVRLAYPLRSTAVQSLADNADELKALTGLIAWARATSPDESINGYIMRPFEFPNLSRFSDGSYGILYVANSIVTAVRETAHHLARIFADGNAPKQDTRKKKLAIDIAGNVHDIRVSIDTTVPADLYNPNYYRAARTFAESSKKRESQVCISTACATGTAATALEPLLRTS
jgi:RES domain